MKQKWFFAECFSAQPTTTAATTTTTTSNQTSSASQTCPQTTAGQGNYVCPSAFRKDPTDCNQFYQCTAHPENNELIITKFTCPTGTAYDEGGCQCVNKTSTLCPSEAQARFEIDVRDSLKYLDPPKNMVKKKELI